MRPTREEEESHSVIGYLRCLSTEELLHLLRNCYESDSDNAFYAKEIISVLESRFDKTQK